MTITPLTCVYYIKASAFEAAAQLWASTPTASQAVLRFDLYTTLYFFMLMSGGGYADLAGGFGGAAGVEGEVEVTLR